MKNVITLGTLWYDIVQTAPKNFEYFNYDINETGSISDTAMMDVFVERHCQYIVKSFEIDFERSLFHVEISSPMKE